MKANQITNNNGSKNTQLYRIINPKKDGILTPCFSAMLLIKKLGPLLIYVIPPKKIAAIDIARSCGIQFKELAYSFT